jgi:hypothetical protein
VRDTHGGGSVDGALGRLEGLLAGRRGQRDQNET